MGKNIYRKMRIATWSLQNPPIQKVYYIPHRLHGLFYPKIVKNYNKLDKIIYYNNRENKKD